MKKEFLFSADNYFYYPARGGPHPEKSSRLKSLNEWNFFTAPPVGGLGSRSFNDKHTRTSPSILHVEARMGRGGTLTSKTGSSTPLHLFILAVQPVTTANRTRRLETKAAAERYTDRTNYNLKIFFNVATGAQIQSLFEGMCFQG